MKLIQIRYFGDNNYPHTQRLDNNYPYNLVSQDLVTGDIFNNYMPIKRLVINSLPGTKFNIDTSNSFSVMGASGVYQIDNINKTISLKFAQESIDYIDINPDGYLIIDIVYEEV